jgi:hypothetical protein
VIGGVVVLWVAIASIREQTFYTAESASRRIEEQEIWLECGTLLGNHPTNRDGSAIFMIVSLPEPVNSARSAFALLLDIHYPKPSLQTQ